MATKLTNFRIDEDQYYTFLTISEKDQTSGNAAINALIREFNTRELAARNMKPVTRAQWEKKHPNQKNKGVRSVEPKAAKKTTSKKSVKK